MSNLAWGGYTNGEIPTNVLVDVSGRGDYMEPTAAANFISMRAAIKRDVGFDLQPASGSSANRTEATQITFFTQRYTRVSRNTGLWWNGSYWTKNAGAAVAAIPGTSNHGWARAIDLNISRYNTAAWAWMQAHAHEYGYDWTTGRASGEDWHWESLTAPGAAVVGGGATPILNRTDDDEMISKEAQAFIKSTVLRESRGRLYYCPNPPAGLPQFVCIFWGREPGPGAVLYGNAGEAQAVNWGKLYGQTWDTVQQAKDTPDTPEQFRTRINLALGKDTAFTNNAAK